MGKDGEGMKGGERRGRKDMGKKVIKRIRPPISYNVTFQWPVSALSYNKIYYFIIKSAGPANVIL